MSRRGSPRPRSIAAAADEPGKGRMRLQSFLSDAGVASRRHAEQMILEGRVLVNGATVERLPVFVDPAVDRIVADGHPVRPQRHEYFLVNKPVGVLCTNHDPEGRTRAIDLLPPLPMQLFPVGRLDADSSGLLLMTNDGDMAQRITHPSYNVPKMYRAEVKGRIEGDLPAKLCKGVFLAEGRAGADEVRVVHVGRTSSVLMITLHEGKNRQIRRMLARFELPVKSLRRVQIGPLSIKGLPLGAARRLTAEELAALRALIAAPLRPQRPRRRPGAAPAATPAGEVTRTRGTDRPRRQGAPRGRSADRPARTDRRNETRRAAQPKPAAPQPKRRMIVDDD